MPAVSERTGAGLTAGDAASDATRANASQATAGSPAPPPQSLPLGAELLALMDRYAADEPWIVAQQLELSAIPAPTGAEQKRARWFLRRLRQLGLRHSGIDAAGNVMAVYGQRSKDAPAIAVSAHLDTVFPAGVDVTPRAANGVLHGPGIADNAAGLAALLVLARLLAETSIGTRMPLLLVANVGEEGEGNLRGMRFLFEQSEWRSRIAGAVVLDGVGSDHATVQALASRRFEVSFRAPGGHSWSDAGAASAITALSRAVVACAAGVQTSRGASSLNVGIMEGGQSINSIPAAARMKVDIRAVEENELARVCGDFKQAVQRAVREENLAASCGQVEVEMRVIGERPAGALPAGCRILRLLAAVDAARGIDTHYQVSSTDANIPLSLGREAVAMGAGGRGGGIHTLGEWFDPTGRALGISRILMLALALASGTNKEEALGPRPELRTTARR